MNTKLSLSGLLLMIATSVPPGLAQIQADNPPPPAKVPSQSDIARLRADLLDPLKRFNALKETASLQQNAAPLLPEVVKLLGDSTIINGWRISGIPLPVGQTGSITLREMKSQAIPLLTLVVKSTGVSPVDVTARLNAILSLKRINDKRIAAPLLIALQDPTEEVRLAALAALRHGQFPGSVVDRFNTTEFLPLTTSRSAFVRGAIIYLLPSTIPSTPDEDKQRADALFRALEDHDKSVKEKAVGVLVQSEGWLKDSRAVEPLVRLLNSPEDIISRQAAFTLAAYNDRRAIPQLILQLGNTDESIVRLSAAKLGELKAREAVDPLIELLSSKKSMSTREAIAGALGSIGDPKALEPLSGLVQIHESERFVYALSNLKEAVRKANP